MEEVNKIFHELAKGAGCCDEWLGKIANATKDGLLDLLVKGIDFTAINPRWFNNVFAVDIFGREMLHKHNIYIDEKIPDRLEGGVYVFLGSCNGESFADNFSAVTVHCMDMCDVRIVAEDFSKLFVNIYHMAKSDVSQRDVSKVYVYVHGGMASLSKSGEVLVRESK